MDPIPDTYYKTASTHIPFKNDMESNLTVAVNTSHFFTCLPLHNVSNVVDEIKAKYLEKEKLREDELNDFVRSIQAENKELEEKYRQNMREQEHQHQKKMSEQEERHRMHLVDVERRAQELTARQRNDFAKEREEFFRLIEEEKKMSEVQRRLRLMKLNVKPRFLCACTCDNCCVHKLPQEQEGTEEIDSDSEKDSEENSELPDIALC